MCGWVDPHGGPKASGGLRHVSPISSRQKQAFFLGYTVHKMLMCTLGRAEEDDRDHYGAYRFPSPACLLVCHDWWW